MTRNVSPRFIGASQAQETDELYLALLTLNHDSFEAPFRVVRDRQSVQHAGMTYEPFAFRYSLPNDRPDGGVPVLRLTIDNVGQEIIDDLRGLPGYLAVDLRWVLRSQPDVVERRLPEMELRGVSYNAGAITGTVVTTPVYEASYSKASYTPSSHPGLF